jgi:hypothetical protein
MTKKNSYEPKHYPLTPEEWDEVSKMSIEERYPYLHYSVSQNGYVDVITNQIMDHGVIENTFWNSGLTDDKGKPTPFKIVQICAPRVNGPYYAPNNPDPYPVVPILNADGDETPATGIHYNTWSKTHLQYTSNISEENVLPFIRHMKYLVSFNDAHYKKLMDWIAWSIQKPEKKLMWAILMISGQGTGKGTFMDRIIRKLVGDKNYTQIGVDNLTSKFNTFVENRKVIFVDEIYNSGSENTNQSKIYDRLKVPISERTMTIEHKGLKPYGVRNYANLFISSNHLNCLKLEQGDRRIYPILHKLTLDLTNSDNSQGIPRKLAEQHYLILKDGSNYAEDWVPENIDKIYSFMMDWEISPDFSRSTPNCENNPDFTELADTALSDTEKTIRDAHDQEHTPFDKIVVSLSDVKSSLGLQNTQNAIANAIKGLGFVKKEGKNNNKNYKLWVHNKFKDYAFIDLFKLWKGEISLNKLLYGEEKEDFVLDDVKEYQQAFGEMPTDSKDNMNDYHIKIDGSFTPFSELTPEQQQEYQNMKDTDPDSFGQISLYLG